MNAKQLIEAIGQEKAYEAFDESERLMLSGLDQFDCRPVEAKTKLGREVRVYCEFFNKREVSFFLVPVRK